MATLLTTLERGLRRWQWQAGLAGVATIALATGVALGRQWLEDRERRAVIAACEAEGASIDASWNDATRERLRAGLLASGASFAPDTVAALIPWFDDYRAAWRTGRAAVCLHGRVEGDWDEGLVDRAGWCFEDRALQFEATIDQIADPRAARRAIRLASYLDPVDACLDPLRLRRLPTPPPEIRQDIRAIRALLNESDALRHVSEYAGALGLAQRAVLRAEALRWPPLLANARLIEGRCMLAIGGYAAAEGLFTRAYFEAQDAGSTEVAFRAARSLMIVLSDLQRYREAELWSRHADVLSAELADLSALDAAEGHYLLAAIYMGLGDDEAAAAEGEQAVLMRAEVLGAEHPITAAAVRSLGKVYLAQGRPEEALEQFERAYAVWLAAVGHDHDYVGGLAVLRARALHDLGRPEQALALALEGLATHEQGLRADHPTTVQNLEVLADIYAALGRVDEAEQARRRAAALARRSPDGEIETSAADPSGSLTAVRARDP